MATPNPAPPAIFSKILGALLQRRRPSPGIAGGSDCAAKDDDQQDVGSACERQDGKRVVKGSRWRNQLFRDKRAEIR